MNAWYVVHTHPHAEQTALLNLARQGFSAYLPRYLKRRRHARRIEAVARPLFPRYLFVNLDLGKMRWRSIMSTIGVRHLISDGDKPVALPDGIVDEIKAREGEDGMVEMRPEAPFEAGQMVQITAGPMCDAIGMFEGLSDKDRVTVLLDLLGRQLRVKLPATAVAAYV